jgi:serine/threonine protein kinase
MSGLEPSMPCPACLLRLGLDSDSPDGLDIGADLRLLAPIGRGPHATVYLARTRDVEPSFVTIKLFDAPVDASRFVARVRDLVTRVEGCAAAQNVTILGAGIAETSRAFVVARYVPGTAVGAYCQQVGRREQDALRLFARLCRLVSQLHHAGIVHGAIKPSNVIIVPAPGGAQPVLLDAGLRVALESSRVGFTSIARDPRLVLPDRRSDIAALRKLAVDLFASRRGPGEGGGLLRALATHEFETASKLAEEADALAGRPS